MGRIRTVKPEFWTDGKIVQLPFQARLLFIGLWNFCDDYGLLRDEPERIKLQILPDDDLSVSGLLDLLNIFELIEILIDEHGERVIRIVHFQDHQKIDHPSKPKINIEHSRKLAIPLPVRRALAEKYGCPPGESVKAECYYCGAEGKITWYRRKNGQPSSWVYFSDLEMEHFLAEDNGGQTTDTNLVLACRSCNRSKSTKSPFQFVLGNTREESRTISLEGKGKEGKGKEDGGAPAPQAQTQKLSDPEKSDPRYERFQQLICEYYKHKTGKAYTFLPKDKHNFKIFLVTNPSADEESVKKWLTNRGRSHVNHHKGVTEWICKLPLYEAGALDKYFEPLKGGKHNATSRTEQRERERRENTERGVSAAVTEFSKKADGLGAEPVSEPDTANGNHYKFLT